MGLSVLALIDINILIDFLTGAEAAREELNRYAKPAISLITWMEVLAGASDDEEALLLRSFLAGFDRVPIDEHVCEVAVDIRRRMRIRLPDSIIWASAQRMNAILVTRNTRDFPEDAPGIRVPYKL